VTDRARARWILAFGAAGLLALSLLCGQLHFVWEGGPDAFEYAHLAGVPVSEVLGSNRTLGYPLFLSVVRLVSPQFTALPLLQLALFVCGVAVFLEGLLGLSVQWRLSCGAAVPLLYSEILTFSNRALTDTLGSAAAVASIGCLLVFVTRATPRRLVFVTLCVFAAYQIRPAYLCLVAIVPILGGALSYYGLPQQSVTRSLRLALVLGAAMAGPLFLTCSIRWMLVNDFSVVSFAGTNAIGIAGQLVSTESLDRVRPDQQPLVKHVLEDADFESALESNEQAMRATGQIGLARGDRMRNRALIDQNYNATIHAFRAAAQALVAAQALPASGNVNQVAVDRILLGTARSLVLASPDLYSVYVLKNYLHGMTRALLAHRAILPMLAVLAMALVVSPPRSVFGHGAQDLRLVLRVLIPLVVVYTSLALAVAALVEPTIDRYAHAAGIFAPSLFGVGTVVAGDSLARIR
jgi:hypothetical protein